ncbi:hypothetical protein CNMCM6106_003663 [Aspergillus hiratsukae]|uniref:Uncharacterized protein n=1 Tax=Aspergillus hiratsukae TaxID=1194566 RepID=A0A8H6Q7C9_9EURO|nr:hypothetical protein CNMCM6106_003663 [Aspergillus hiratsukae]
METPAEQMPTGWTNKPALLRMFFHYHSAEAQLAWCHGIDNPELLLMRTPESGDMAYIITSGGRFYWGHLMVDPMAEITKPKTWPEILRALATQGEKGLRMKELRQVREVEEEPQEEEMPTGWTNSPSLLEGFFHYHSAEAYLARCHGLDDGKILLMTTPESGDMGYIFTSGGRFYWSDLMIDHIAEVTKPKTWPAILCALATRGEKGLRMKMLRPVREYEEGPWEEEMVDEGPDLFIPPPDAPSTSEK